MYYALPVEARVAFRKYIHVAGHTSVTRFHELAESSFNVEYFCSYPGDYLNALANCTKEELFQVVDRIIKEKS